MSRCRLGRQRAGDDGCEARESSLPLGSNPSYFSSVDKQLTLVLPAQSDAGASIESLEIGGCGDAAERRNGETPADVVVGLPIDDLLERGEPPAHALREGPHAPPAAR